MSCLLKRSNINVRERAEGASTSVGWVGDVALVVGFGVKGFSGNIGFGEDRKQVDPEPLELLVRIHQLAYDLVDDAGFTSRVFDPVGQLRRPSFGLLDNPTAQGVKRSEEHTSELQSLMRISYAVFCLKKKK